MKLLLGDCLSKLKELEDNSIDSIVTDPPYGLSFMGKDWDTVKATRETQSQVVKGLGAGMKMTTLADNIEFEKWVTEWSMECMRVLKPGGYMLAFGGSRMYHRLASGVENAGFEIRDQMMWIYGSGFPKSRDIGKDIEKIKVGGIKNLKQIGTKQGIKVETGTSGYSYSKEYVPGKSMGGKQISGDIPVYEITNEWGGWGTALKPAHEPIVMARKPLSEKTVGNNVLEWGTGGINIDDSRIPTNDNLGGGATNGSVLDIEGFDRPWMHDEEKMKEFGEKMKQKVEHSQTLGRFPANIIFDEEAGKILDEQYEGVSRFFYCPKTSKGDRNEGNIHPTVKPTDLMLYLIRLVTPKGGTTLDPFMGSGSTGKAAIRGGFDFVGIEREKEYMEIAENRINYEISNPYKEESDKKVEVKAEVVDKLNQFFR
jgi:DNA modification methylase